MGMDQVNITSSEFETFATHSFVSLFNDKEFTDVTLVCDDSKQITAHKAILASSSPFFRAVLTQNAHPHPLLYLKGISLSQLQAILEFVYLGKTEICQDNIQEFFVTAKDLQIEGLTNNIRVDAVEKNSENSECMFEASLENITDIAPEENKPTEMGEDVLIKQENGGLEKYACNACTYKSSSTGNLNRHKRIVHDGTRYACTVCDFQTTRTDHLKGRMKRMHSLANVV